MDAIHVSTSAVAIGRLVQSKNSDDIELKNIHTTYALLNKLILQHVHKMNPQSVANCMWSLGKAVDILGVKKKLEYNHVFKKLSERLVVICNGLTTQEASNSLWAMVKFQWDEDSLIRKVVQQAIILSKEKFTPQDISNILWEMATFKFQDIKTIEHFVELSKKCVQEMIGQEVANLIWSLQQLQYYDKELILQIEDYILFKKNVVYNSQSISNIMMAFTDFGLHNKQKIFKIMIHEFFSNRFLKSQDWSNFLYALAVLNCPLNLSQKVVDKMLVQQNQTSNSQNFQKIQLRQLQLAKIFYNIMGQKLLFPFELQQRCRKELQDYRRTQPQKPFLDVVFPTFQNYFAFARKNTPIYDDQIMIDIGLQKDENIKIAVLTFSTKAYYINCHDKLLGRREQHNILLRQLGWQVVMISAFKWDDPQYQKQIISDIMAKLYQTN